jgi:hypothetical protein
MAADVCDLLRMAQTSRLCGIVFGFGRLRVIVSFRQRFGVFAVQQCLQRVLHVGLLSTVGSAPRSQLSMTSPVRLKAAKHFQWKRRSRNCEPSRKVAKMCPPSIGSPQ